MNERRHQNESKILGSSRIFLFLPTPHPESSETPINTGKLPFQHSPQLPTQTPPNTPPNTPPSVHFPCTIRGWGVEKNNGKKPPRRSSKRRSKEEGTKSRSSTLEDYGFDASSLRLHEIKRSEEMITFSDPLILVITYFQTIPSSRDL